MSALGDSHQLGHSVLVTHRASWSHIKGGSEGSLYKGQATWDTSGRQLGDTSGHRAAMLAWH